MHSTFVNQLRNCFPEMIVELKSNALVPLLRLFLEELEARGFVLEEIIFALQTISEERGLKQVSSSLEEILSNSEKEI